MHSGTELEAIDDLILGRGVRRGRHRLGQEESLWFLERLPLCGFSPRVVSAIDIEVGVRVPAWHVTQSVMDFGMVFWEVFTHRAKRKLFASEIRNAAGDWEIQLGTASSREIFVNLSLAERYDASRPVGMY